MDKVFFEERVKAVPEDMNALHENTELAFAALIEAMAGNVNDVLLKDAPPTVTHPPGSLQTSIPEQWFAVDGIFCKIPASVDLRADTADYLRIYFVAYRTNVTGSRDRYTLSGGSVVVAPDTVIIRKPSNCRIEITASGNPLVAPGPPTLGPGDIDYLLYCDIVWTGSGDPYVTPNSVSPNVAALWSFPGAGISYTPHAATHIPAPYGSGTDVIQLADLTGKPGLMPAGSFIILKDSLNTVETDIAAPYITRSQTGDNSPGNPKTVTIGMNLHESLTVRDTDKLGLAFRAGPNAGTDERAARFDHRHSPGESPIAVEFARIDVDSGDLGQELAIPDFASLARIMTTQVFWMPPLSNDDPYPRFDCLWLYSAAGIIGARAHIIGGDQVVIETGAAAFIELSSAGLARASAAVGGTPTWTNAGTAAKPTSGVLFVKVVGER